MKTFSKSLPLRCHLRLRLFRHELRVVATVEEDHPVQFIALHHGLTSALGGVHLGVAIPRPLDGWLAVPGGLATIHLTLDVAKMKLAPAPVVEFDECLDYFVKEVVVPGRNRDDAPATGEGKCRFWLLCHRSFLATLAVDFFTG